MSMYKQFQTDPQVEISGIYVDYGEFRVLLARTGGANTRYLKALDAETKPFRRAIQNELLDVDRIRVLAQRAFVNTCVLNWEVKRGDQWVQGIEASEGEELLEFTKENVFLTFKNLPDLAQDLENQAGKSALYRAEVLEEAAKN